MLILKILLLKNPIKKLIKMEMYILEVGKMGNLMDMEL